ncbi:MAG: hypothetical protein Q8M99_01090 [Methylotenera sp.]|nr:hypothetical protein [Methylotenera sp.]
MTLNRRITLVALSVVFSSSAWAGEVAHYWVDAATYGSSIPGMEGMGALANMMGGGSEAVSFGITEGGGGNGRYLDVVLQATKSTQASHAVPSGLLGSPLILTKPATTPPSRKLGREQQFDPTQKPADFKIKYYWGCAEQAKSGQPKVMTPKNLNAGAMRNDNASKRGAWGHVANNLRWPNEQNSQKLSDSASLVGSHTLSGEGVPANFNFNLVANNDFLDKINLATSGDFKKDTLKLNWNAINNAKGYFLSAMGVKSDSNNATEMTIWVSSEQQDQGHGLINYLEPKLLDQYLKQKVVLPTSIQTCSIPAGIFKDSDMVNISMVAYGPELNISYPDTKDKKKIEWDMRLRTKSVVSTMLMGAESGGGNFTGRNYTGRNYTSSQKGSNAGTSEPNPIEGVKKLKGLFGL